LEVEMKRVIPIAVSLGAVLCLWMGSLAAAPAQSGLFAAPLRISGDAINMSNIGTGDIARVNIYISRWTLDKERDQIVEGFVEKGPDELLKRLQDAKSTGRLSAPGDIGYALRYARFTPQGEGAQIVLLTDRPISGWEAYNRPRTIDYPFTLIELHMNELGTGEGKLSVATKVSYNKYSKTIALETYTSEPIRLQNLKIER
jgi:hypothetical protein